MSSFWLEGVCERELGDCGTDLMLALCPRLQASGPLPFTFCPGNEAGCLDTFGRQLLHMGCGQRVCVCVLQDSGPWQTACFVCVWKCVCSWVSSTVLNLDRFFFFFFLSTNRRSVWGFVCFHLRSSGRSVQLSSLDLLTGVCQLYQAGIITGQ